jgi:hypothetical protein
MLLVVAALIQIYEEISAYKFKSRRHTGNTAITEPCRFP